MTSPPIQAPSALATLSAAWFIAAPSVCASPDTDIRRSWRFTTSTEPIAVTEKIAGSSHQPYGATAQTSSMTRPEPTPAEINDLKTDHSARRPASQVPATMPTPNAAVKTGTADSGSPPTSVTVGAM